MAHTSAPIPSSVCPSLAEIAESVHHASTDRPVARFVHVALHPAEEALDIGLWDLPEQFGHPVAPLVGFRAPRSWDALGIVTSGRLHHLDDPDSDPTAIVSTVLIDRAGEAASIIGGDHHPMRVLHDPPVGLVPDVLARGLGLPTPPPELSVASFIDLTWLDRIATGLLERPSRGRSWRWLADRHPLRGPGSPPEPALLAIEVAAYAATHPWSVLLDRNRGIELPAATLGPPGGTVLDAGAWFDEGSLSRWASHQLPPAEALVPDLLAVLDPNVGEQLLTALSDESVPWR